jgi:DNA repair exonuclease SbcCD ATPase subunit
MQSTTNVRDLSSYLENRSPERSPERAPRTPTFSEPEKSRDLSPIRSGSPTPTRRDSGRETPTLRPSSRYLSKPILGENTPPSATMLALQNMQVPPSTDLPLSNITNSSTNSSTLVRTPQSFDAISSQILGLTNIATNLQREMAQLSRRSKDNATDLVSLKEATNSRDEDIRKSLRELVSNISTKFLEPHPNEKSKNGKNLSAGSFMIDSKPYGSPEGLRKNFSLPRIPSPSSFAAAIERDMTASPSTISSDGSASIALLEKILREMSTKDGQEKVLKMLGEMKSKPKEPTRETIKEAPTDPLILKKLDDIVHLVKEAKEDRADRAIVRAGKDSGIGDQPPHLELDFDQPRSGPLTRGRPGASPKDFDAKKENATTQPSDFVNEEIMKILKKVKNSVAEGGGLTNEVKALIRDLRGEVLGMGREIARKLEQAESSNNAPRDDTRGPGREEIAHIVETGLAELREHMDHLIREKRRQSSSSTVSRATVDSQEVYHAVKNALSQYPLPVQQAHGPGIEKEEILEAVREAWETYKPEIELQNFGLERDEILECLKEGLKEYRPQQQSRDAGLTHEEVFEAVRRGMSTFTPPPVETEASITREEIIMTVRECLESFDFPTAAPAPAPRELDLTRDDVIDAVKEGLLNQGPITKEVEFNREDLFDAIKAGLEGAPTPMDGVGEQVLEKMHELIEGMRGEFKQYSAANGRDTEQVLDAMKDGLETLRGDIESYVDRAADVTGKDEIIDVVKDGLRQVQTDLQSSIENSPRARTSDTTELLDAMEKEFEHLRQTISNMLIRQGGSSDKDEILDAIRDISDRDRDDGSSISGDRSNHILRNMKEEFEHLRETLATTMMRHGSSSDKEEIIDAIREAGMDAPRRRDGNESILSNTSELLEAFNEGLEGLKSDMEKLMNKPVDLGTNYEILDTLKDGLASVKEDISRLHVSQKEYEDSSTIRGREVMVADENQLKTDIESLKVMITQLRIKVESLDFTPPPPPPESFANGLNKDDLDGIHATLREVRESVHTFGTRDASSSARENAATKDDIDAIETLLRNTKAQLDDMATRETDSTTNADRFESVETAVKDTKEAIDELAANLESHGASKQDVGILEALLNEVTAGMEDIQTKMKLGVEEMATKTDIHVIETLCLDTKTQITELVLPDVETMPTKDDIAALEEKINGFKEQVEAESELSAQAFEARKTEHGGLANKIEDVKSFLDDLRDELKSKLDDGSHGLIELGKTLDIWKDENLTTYASAKSVHELTELVSREFERSHGNHDTVRLDTEERDATLLVRHDESRAAVIAELGCKIDDRFNEIMTKYDDAQLAADAKLHAFDSRDSQNLEALTSTRAVVDDVKLLIDTLGTTVTETCDRLNDDSKTVFNKVEESVSRLDVIQADSKFEHGLTRDEVVKTVASSSRVEAQLAEWHPQIFNTVKDLLLMVSQHYEHSQKSSDEIKASVVASISAIPMPAIGAAPPSPPLLREIPVTEKYDDSQVHDKLNVLLNHATAAGKSFLQIDRLDQIHEQVKVTSNEISEMVATQSRLMAENHESKQQEAQEAAIALEKRLAQKERVEAEIVSLNEEKDALLYAVQAMKQEKEDLARQNMKVSKEVSSLETALQIRREEMRIMEDRAEGLERRILEGVLDHARSVLISKPSSTKDMNLKRVPSSASTVTRASTVGTGRDSSILSSSIGMALKRRTPMSSNTGSISSNSSKGRRILSLSHVTGNKGAIDRQIMLAPTRGEGGLMNLKRSHSVKSNFPARKSSWAGRGSVVDKENVFHEEDEAVVSGDEASDAGTERRTSYTGTCTDSFTYGTGSTLSTTETEDRHSSYGTSTGALIGGMESSVEDTEDNDEESGRDLHEGEVEESQLGSHEGEVEESQLGSHEGQLVLKDPLAQGEGNAGTMTLREESEYADSEAYRNEHGHHEDEDDEEMRALSAPDHLMDDLLHELQPPKPSFGEVVMYEPHSDSGLGTDVPTADGGSLPGHDYFEHK